MTTNPNYSNCISNSKEEEEAMLSDREETPTRFDRLELLSMVKKHSKLLGKTIVDKEDASDVEMDSRFWHGVMDLYFVRGRESRGRQDDDLVFFVRKLILQGYGSSDDMEGNSPYFVRRWAPKLDALVDRDSVHVDWRSSFYLNLIAHTSFSVTVAICSHQILRNHQSGNDTPLSSIYKEVETTPAYPDICFAVDDFDSTFDAVVLTDTDHCYCVLLNADGGAAFPSAKPAQDCSSSDTLRSSTGSAKTKKTKLTLFSGFVNYQMVRDAYEAGKSGFGSLLSLGHSPGKIDRIYMKGPGGRGEVEVAVSGVIDQSKEGSSPSSQSSKREFGFGTIVRRAASVASVAAKHAYAAAAATRGPDEEMLPLKCCLMSISLPWEDIAYDLLFKGSPPVNL
ncbi:Protein of unknown function DUF2045 protein [Actinidia chinensis var. chinensis]|uniref:Cw7 protein n=1 Tax=Actinidia chinensis var. chinensis TaxID=1590841 RepID=A0A2R6R369_ACTCC|nr:Protein of unknown function DUF2045 protein [Actinidia chinensis var. chinensis]